jgi:hypothetical protein
MALLVVLVPEAESRTSLDPATVNALAQLGVTSVSLARDDDTTAVVLEGWAFDPTRPDAVLAALGTGGRARALLPIGQLAVATAVTQGGLP